MPKKNLELEKYKKETSKRLEELIPVFQKIANGDFSSEVSIPEGEDEFTPLVITLSMLLDDLKFLDKENKTKTEELEESKKNLEAKVEQLENFQRIVVGRELKMKDLKEENENLKSQLGECKKNKTD